MKECSSQNADSSDVALLQWVVQGFKDMVFLKNQNNAHSNDIDYTSQYFEKTFSKVENRFAQQK